MLLHEIFYEKMYSQNMIKINITSNVNAICLFETTSLKGHTHYAISVGSELKSELELVIYGIFYC